MLLSKPQKYMIDTLKELKYLRASQLHALTRNAFQPQMNIAPHHTEIMLRQLRTVTNVVRIKEDIVSYGERSPDARRLEAIDVMLELTENKPSYFSCQGILSPRLLCFTGSNELKGTLFSVAWLETPMQIVTISRMKGERIIWLSNTITPETLGVLPQHHFFAQLQNDDSHRYFGSTELQKIK